MNHRSDPDIVKRLNLFVAVAAIFSMVVGLSVLAGWALNVAALVTWGEGTAMAPNAAACLLLAGLALWLLRESDRRPLTSARKIAAKTPAAMASLTGLFTLAEQLVRRDIGIDRLLLLQAPGPQIAGARMVMSPVAAGAFLLLGLALLGIDWRTGKKKWPAQFLCLGAAFTPAFGLLGVMMGPRVSPITLALPSVAGFVALTAGLLCSRPTWALGGLLTRKSRGAKLLRAALPAALGVLGLLGWLISKPLLTEVHFSWVEVTLLAIVIGAMLAGFIGWTAMVVDHSDDERRKLEEVLHLDQEQVDRLLEQMEQPESEARLRRRVQAAMAMAVLLIVLMGALSWHMLGQSAQDGDWVAHTYNVSRTLEVTLRHLDDVETGARGFALTGEKQFLQPYQLGKYEVSKDLEGLRVLIGDNPDQERRLDVLVEQTRSRLEEADELVELRQNSGQLPTVDSLHQGKQLMDAVRTTIATMEAEETRLLEQRIRRVRRSQHFANTTAEFGSILGMLFLFFAGITVNREMRVTARAQAQVKALNADLENRVEQRTAALEAEVAARQGTEAKLRSSEELFRMLLDGITDYAVYMLDVEGRVVSWNSGAARIQGYSAEEVIGKHVSCFYTATDRELNCPQDSLSEAAEAGRFEGEGWRLRKDGSAFWANVVITPVHRPDGNLSGYSTVVRDITARKRADQEQRKQSALLDLALDAIFVRDLQSRVTFWNRGAENMFGWSATEANGQVSHELLQTEFPLPLHAIEAELTSKGDWEGELRHRTRQGKEVVVTSRWALQRDERGVPTAILEINRDITNRKLAEAALNESENRLAGVIASAMDAIITVDEQQCIVLFNRAAQKMFRCLEHEAMGQPITRFIPQRFHAGHAGHIRKFGEKGITKRAMGAPDVLWGLRADGQEFQVEASISQVVAGGKKLFTVILRDVMERKQAEQVRERLAAVVDSSDDAIISKTLEGIITAWNRGAQAIFGYTAEEAIGKPMLMLLPPERAQEEADILARIGRGHSVEHFETVRVRKDGTKIDVSVTISPIRDIDGMIVGASKIARDITERKRAEDALRESEERLRLALEGGRLGTWQWKLETDELDGSPLSFALFGLPAYTKFTFAGFRAGLHPQDRILVDESMRRCLAGEAEYDAEYRALWPDGTEHWVAARGQAYKNGVNEITHVRGVVSDITDRRQAQVALRESQEQFQVMANGIQQLAWMAEADGSIFWYNQRWYDYTGTTLGQTEGWTWEKIHDPAVLPEVLRGWREALAGGTPFDMEFPLRGADGSFRMFLTRVMPVRNAEGRVVRWLGTNTDISERKKAEEHLARLAVELGQQAEDLAHSREDLEQQSSMLKLILESMGEGLIAADADGHFLLWNDAANKLMGRGAADVPREEWTPHYEVFLADAITPCPVDRLPLVRALGGESVHEELMIRPPEPGAMKFIEVTARPLKDARGTLRGGVAVLHDITERKRSEAELTQQAEDLAHSRQDLEAQKLMLQSVLNSMVEGLVAADKQGKFILWNPAADKIMGLGPTNLPSTDWAAHYGLFLPDTITPIPPGETPMERTLRGEAGTTEIFLRHAGLDRGLWLEATGSPLLDKDGVMLGAVLAFRDITRRKTDELEIRKLNEELEERIAKRTAQLETANHELEAFSYSVSHDLRAPLRHIGGFARILISDFGSGMAPEAKGHLQRIDDAVIRMGMLVDGLLSLAKLGRQSFKLRPTDLNAVVAESISVLQPEYEGREVEWRIAPLPALECDVVLMGQVFQNLLGNALKYSRGRCKTVIEVDSIQQAGEPAVIFVRDNGAGFDMQYAEKLFGVFQRMHTEAEFEGTGVGLATVQRIIQKHGGRIWAEAETDHGATFYFTLGGNGDTKTVTRPIAAAR